MCVYICIYTYTKHIQIYMMLLCVYIFHLYIHTNIHTIPSLALYKTNLRNLPLTNLFCIHIHVIYFNALEVF